MATAPKAAPKVVPIDEAASAAAAPKKSKSKLFLIVALLLVAIGGGAGATWFFVGSKPAEGEAAEAKPVPAKPPVYMPMEQFTVNLQSDGFGDQYLQLAFTLQVADEKQVEQIKLYMPLVRSRVLMLLSSKKASELNTVEGKKTLSEDIVAQINQPFTPQSEPQQVTGVFFTSFVIQ